MLVFCLVQLHNLERHVGIGVSCIDMSTAIGTGAGRGIHIADWGRGDSYWCRQAQMKYELRFVNRHGHR